MMRFNKRWARVTATVLGVALGVVTLWYGANRIISSGNAVRIIGSNGDRSDGIDQAVSEWKIGTFNIAHGRGTASSNWKGAMKQNAWPGSRISLV